jgi:hypothetical protein
MKLHEKIEEVRTILKDDLEPRIGRIENEAEPFDKAEAFDALLIITDFKREIREYEERINTLLTQWMAFNGEKMIDFGGMVAERKRSSTRKNWQHDTLLEAVVNTSIADEQGSIVNPETGELIDVISFAKPIIDAVVKNVQAAAAIREWRVTALRTMIPGLNPDDFCEIEVSEKVSIRRK